MDKSQMLMEKGEESNADGASVEGQESGRAELDNILMELVR